MDRRDKSKQIKKADKGQKKISIESLRKGGNKGQGGGKKTLVLSKKGGDKGGQQGDKGDKRRKKVLGRRPGKGGRFGKKGGGKPKNPEEQADALDKDLEGYWVKGGNTELGKCSHSDY